jgi:hypothetical protein
MVIVFSEGSEVEIVNGTVPPMRNCDSSPRYCAGAEGVKEKPSQIEVS